MPTTMRLPDGQTFEIWSRGEWGARPADPPTNFLGNDQAFVGHHSVTPETDTLNESIAMMRLIERLHRDDNGWSDIAYNWCYDQHGRVFEGRGLYGQNAANTGRGFVTNSNSLSGCYLGNTETGLYPVAAQQAFAKLAVWLDATPEVCDGPDGCALLGHRQVGSTLCPGAKKQAFINDGAPLATGPVTPVWDRVAFEQNVADVFIRSYKLGAEEAAEVIEAIEDGDLATAEQVAQGIGRRFEGLGAYWAQHAIEG